MLTVVNTSLHKWKGSRKGRATARHFEASLVSLGFEQDCEIIRKARDVSRGENASRRRGPDQQ